MRSRRLLVCAPAACSLLVALTAPRHATADTGPAPTYVYFDQNEEEDLYQTGQPAYSGRATNMIVPPWDPNGQMCILPDGSGRFTVGYNPTGVEQKNADGTQNKGALLPRKQPPVGVAIHDRNGTFSGQTLYVPGPYKLTPASKQWNGAVVGPDAGGDIPPDKDGTFNSNGTFTGCAVDHHGNLLAVDLGSSQGSYPPHDDGRLLEWFAPDYTEVCIVYGPNSGGDAATAHHVDGHGGLQQPGPLATDAKGNLYVPVVEADPNTKMPQGKILEFAASGLPATPRNCPGSHGTQSSYHVAAPTTFIDTSAHGIFFPQGIARDPVCGCWAVDNVLNQEPGPAIAWFDDAGNPATPDKHLPIPANYGGTQFSPFGMAFDPAGDLFVVDIHVQVDAAGSLSSQSLQAGPQDGQGRLLEFTFSGPVANPPVTIASGENFPVGVTTCTPSATQVCPAPSPPTAPPGEAGAQQQQQQQQPEVAAQVEAATTLPNTAAAGRDRAAAAIALLSLSAIPAWARRRRGRACAAPVSGPRSSR